MKVKVFHFPDQKKMAVELEVDYLPAGFGGFLDNLIQDAVDDFNSAHKEWPAREVFLMPTGHIQVTSGLATGAQKQRYLILPGWKV